MKWVGTWTTAPVALDGIVLSNQTIRMIAHVSIGGSRLRVRLSNAFGLQKLAIGSAHVAVRDKEAAIVAGTDRVLTFNGQPSTIIAVGAPVVSDPVDLDVPPLVDLAISVHLPADLPESFRLTGHGNARQTSYISPPGDFTSANEMPVQEATQAWLFATGVEMEAPDEANGVVAFGDSLTDGNISTVDANQRWPNQLARRLVKRSNERLVSVMNQGIGGNRILHDVRGESGQRRFDRDVLGQPGVTHAIVLLGINDIRNRNQDPDEVVTAQQMIGGLNQLALRARARGVKIYGGTLLTFENETFNPGFYSPEGEAKRQAVNAWIRDGGAFDAVIDFEKGLRDPGHPTRMLPEYDCGDHLHPSDAGYRHMGDIIDLGLFDQAQY